MKLIQNIIVGCIVLTTAYSLTSCSAKDEYREINFAQKPTVQISVTPISGMTNRYLITDQTQGAFIHEWNLGLGGPNFAGQKSDTAYYPEKGTYWLKLKSFTPNGWALDSVQVTVAEDDPDRCSGTLAILTGCDFKVWVLDHVQPGALWVGSPDGQQWWASGAPEVGIRSCLFNDEYTFNINGKFGFDNKGDMWVDEEGGLTWPTEWSLPIGCANFSQIPAGYEAWGSNANHNFSTTGNTLNLSGTGAFIGLYKAGIAGVTAVPESGNSYTLENVSENRITLVKAYDWGTWKFTIIPKE